MESVIPPKPAKRLGMPKLSIPSRPSSSASASGSRPPPFGGTGAAYSTTAGSGSGSGSGNGNGNGGARPPSSSSASSFEAGIAPPPLTLRSHPSSARSSIGSLQSFQGVGIAPSGGQEQPNSNSNTSSPSHEWHLGSGSTSSGFASTAGPSLLHIPSHPTTGASSTYSTNATVRGGQHSTGGYGYGSGYGGEYADPAAMTNDLRRAISGLSLSSSRGSVDLDADDRGSSENADHRAGSGVGSLADPRRERSRAVSASGSDAGRSEGGMHSSSVGDASLGSTTGETSTASEHASSSSRPVYPRSHSSRTDDGAGSQAGHDDELVLQGNLRNLSRLGEGSSGEVHKALHVPTALMMAKKSISTSPNPDIHRQILRELLFLRTCHSPYIVKYYGAFLEDEDTQIAICMEYCEGGSLEAVYRRVMARGGRTGEKVLAKVAECVLKGLEYLHERNIIHRDIKPSNILLTRQGQIKLCDLGVAGELVDSVAGTFTGTSYYMAPERIQGLPNYKINSDVWSLGLSLLEVASNRFPFPPEGEPPLGPFDLITYVIAMDIPQLKDEPAKGVKWSKMMRDFIERTLEKDPGKRPGPVRMIQHPWIRRSEEREPQPDIGKFLAEVWGWTGTGAETETGSG
ncbi:unnamed protein product [Tilletia controversa]|uniref:Protein kinase domain-containing protein n=1 Tax=Tilletia controversa TaxID=13291 RepID=A0A8X7MYF2_9BASI|nr:hypothetical protein CF328_g785 [Tilletia controversa]KAE8254293.1 hypothetical protein A4X06_0g969 [Tilletia controversa]CAD6899833.1 unnamed protein product [Tilletia controversa]CAD6908043.1 unnamed protein product [Tilletia controversa]CAD6912286.1 unnamed protein product [Tilletia controversa]